MKTLIVAATHAELAGFCAHFGLPEIKFVSGEMFDVLITGVGMTATAFALGQHLPNHYDLILNLGIAGCYEWKYPLGSLLNITTDTFSELGAEDKEEFLSIDSLGFGKGTFHSSPPPDLNLVSDLPEVSGITVNKVHGNKRTIREIERRLRPTTESMEGAAVFYCAEQLNIPCLQIRSISNYVEERNKESWRIGLAIRNLNDWAIKFVTAN